MAGRQVAAGRLRHPVRPLAGRRPDDRGKGLATPQAGRPGTQLRAGDHPLAAPADPRRARRADDQGRAESVACRPDRPLRPPRPRHRRHRRPRPAPAGEAESGTGAGPARLLRRHPAVLQRREGRHRPGNRPEPGQELRPARPAADDQVRPAAARQHRHRMAPAPAAAPRPLGRRLPADPPVAQGPRRHQPLALLAGALAATGAAAEQGRRQPLPAGFPGTRLLRLPRRRPHQRALQAEQPPGLARSAHHAARAQRRQHPPRHGVLQPWRGDQRPARVVSRRAVIQS
ncbi:hypothetical protein D9M71_522630 [compost metagenome]